MAKHASGTFEVKLAPLAEDKGEGSTLGRMSIDKQFHGDLEGTSKGEMLTAMTEVKGSAGYVAIERVSGTLHGRKGSFVLLGLQERWTSGSPTENTSTNSSTSYRNEKARAMWWLTASATRGVRLSSDGFRLAGRPRRIPRAIDYK